MNDGTCLLAFFSVKFPSAWEFDREFSQKVETPGLEAGNSCPWCF
ncbi:hypothetical protein HMPREF0322_01975 [Desulfitobacterium hafniense DP7]|uniref:Uncharacterized protein n=1 Tax=Desulfitobacterium hafniense DP7 TaxID=537010 RepID=G9XLY9_DESHA|nr:hypothetical protein HMPREF0322_01975 [Desulfitobacterium hafniense DP7]